MRSPSRLVTSPVWAFSSPRTTRTKVVLPAPLGPIRVIICPACTFRLTCFRTSRSPRRKPTLLASSRQVLSMVGRPLDRELAREVHPPIIKSLNGILFHFNIHRISGPQTHDSTLPACHSRRVAGANCPAGAAAGTGLDQTPAAYRLGDHRRSQQPLPAHRRQPVSTRCHPAPVGRAQTCRGRAAVVGGAGDGDLSGRHHVADRPPGAHTPGVLPA